MTEQLPGLSPSDTQLLDSLISKDDKAKATIEANKVACATKFQGLADKLNEVAKSHPDAIAEFLAQQRELRGFSKSRPGEVAATADDIRTFTPPNWSPGEDLGIAGASKYLQASRTKHCIDDIVSQQIPNSPNAESNGKSK